MPTNASNWVGGSDIVIDSNRESSLLVFVCFAVDTRGNKMEIEGDA